MNKFLYFLKLTSITVVAASLIPAGYVITVAIANKINDLYKYRNIAIHKAGTSGEHTYGGLYNSAAQTGEKLFNIGNKDILEKWGVNGAGDELQFGYKTNSTDAYLCGWKFLTNEAVWLTMQDTITYGNTTYNVKGLSGSSGSTTISGTSYGSADPMNIGNSIDDSGCFGRGDGANTHAPQQCQQLYGFSTNEIMETLPSRAFYGCKNLQSIYLGEKIWDKPYDDGKPRKTIWFANCPNLNYASLSVSPKNTHMKLMKCVVNNVPGAAIVNLDSNGKATNITGNTTCAGALNISQLLDKDPSSGLITVPECFADSAWAVTEVDMQYVGQVLNRAFFNSPNINNVYLYNNCDFLVNTSSNSGIYWEIITDGKQLSPWHWGRGIFSNYNPNNDPNENANPKTVIHLPIGADVVPSGGQSQLTVYRSHKGDRYSNQNDTAAILGIATDEQFVVSTPIESIDILAPENEPVQPGGSYVDWNVIADSGEGQNPQETYYWEITNGNDNGYFDINPYTGEIYVSKDADAGEYELTLQATVTYTMTEDEPITAEKTVKFEVAQKDTYLLNLNGQQHIDVDNTMAYSVAYTLSTDCPHYESIEFDYEWQENPNQDILYTKTNDTLSHLYIPNGISAKIYKLKLIANLTFLEVNGEEKTISTSLNVVINAVGFSLNLSCDNTVYDVYCNDGLQPSNEITASISPSGYTGNIKYKWLVETAPTSFSSINEYSLTQRGDHDEYCTLKINPTKVNQLGSQAFVIKCYLEENDALFKTITLHPNVLQKELLISSPDTPTTNNNITLNVTKYIGKSIDFNASYNGSDVSNSTNFQIATDGSLPNWINFNSNQLVISRSCDTKTDESVSTYNFLINAIYNSTTSTNTIQLTVNVTLPSLSIAGNTTINFTKGLTITQSETYTSTINVPNITEEAFQSLTYTWTYTTTSTIPAGLLKFSNNSNAYTIELLDKNPTLIEEYEIKLFCKCDQLFIDGTSIEYLTASLDVDVIIGTFNMTTLYSGDAPLGAAGHTISRLAGANTLSFSFTTSVTLSGSSTPVDQTYTYVFVDSTIVPSGISLTSDGTVTITSEFVLIGNHSLKIRVVGQKNGATSDFIYVFNCHDSGVSIGTDDTNAFTTSIGGTIHYWHTVVTSYDGQSWSATQNVTWSIDDDSITAGFSIDDNGNLTVPYQLTSWSYQVKVTCTSADTDLFSTDNLPFAELTQNIYIADPTVVISSHYGDTINWFEGQSGTANRFYVSAQELTDYDYTSNWEIGIVQYDNTVVNNQYVTISNSGVMSLDGQLQAQNYVIRVVVHVHHKGHVFTQFEDYTLNNQLPVLSVRGPSLIKLDRNYAYQQFNYAYLSNDSYQGEVTFSLLDECEYPGVTISGSTLTVNNEVFVTNTIVTFTIQAVTANGNVVAQKNVTLMLNANPKFLIITSILLPIVCVFLLVIVFFVNAVSITRRYEK